MNSPAFSTDVSLNNAFICHMIVALALKTSDWFAFAFVYQHFLVADSKAIENCFVWTVWVSECDNYMSYHLVWVLSLRGLGPSALADGSVG